MRGLVVVCLLLPTVAAAQPRVDVVGNNRTDADTIITAAELPTQLDATALAEARQRLLNTKLFESVDISSSTDDKITIAVKERWTLFPIPYFSSSSRGQQGGIFLLETNLFGRRKTAVAGGSYASWGGSAFAMYQDPSVANTHAVFRVTGQFLKEQRERRVDDNVVFGYDDTRFDSSILAGYRISRLTLSGGWFFTHTSAASNPDDVMGLPTGIQHGWIASAEYRGADTTLYFDKGLTASVLYRQALHALGADRNDIDVSARAAFTQNLIGNQATTLLAQVEVAEGDPIVDARMLGGRTGSRGFDTQTLWADRAALLTLDHQIPVFMRGWGIITAAAFVDAGYVALDKQTVRFVTPGAGVRMYLPRVNFPAIGVDLSYSLDTERLFTTVSVGLSL